MNTKPIYTAKSHWVLQIIPMIKMIISLPFVIIGIRCLIKVLSGNYHWGEMGMLVLICLPMSYLFYKSLSAYIYNRNFSIKLYDKHITIHRKILFSHTVTDIKLEKITEIHFFQSLLGRIFNFGVLVLASSGGNEEFFYIIKPFDLREKLTELKQL